MTLRKYRDRRASLQRIIAGRALMHECTQYRGRYSDVHTNAGARRENRAPETWR